MTSKVSYSPHGVKSDLRRGGNRIFRQYDRHVEISYDHTGNP